MAKTQTWRGDKSRAKTKSLWSGQSLYSLYTSKLTVSVTQRNPE